ncbi:MAG: RnfABCDGE type electron transport complex subunit D [Firmicutes bacterium]|nr:RnfABCDGE type electron transport complex subunit D [Bacillota bacterium]
MLKTGPYLRSSLTIEQVMVDVLIALIPALIAGVIFFGRQALWIVFLSTLTAILTGAVLLRAPFNLRGILGDGSAAVTGLLLGLILPSTAAWWVPVVGSFLAISLIKLAFGGLGYNIFNPALGARAILLLAFTSQLVKFAVPFDTITAATPLLSSRTFSWPLLWGNVGGSIGETSVIAILLGGFYLLYKGHINWRIPIGYVGSAFVLALLWGLDPWFTITTGGLLFAAVFMATDMVTSPVTFGGQLVFGVGCGILTIFIRQYTSFPEGVTFAVLIMNALAPLIESVTIPIPFGVGLARETRLKGIAAAGAALLVAVGALVWIDNTQPALTPILSHGQHLPIADWLGTSDFESLDFEGSRFYVTWNEEEKPAKAVYLAEQGGFNGPIRFLLVLDQEQNITDLRILDHREDPGLGELITKPEFLDQFVGKNKHNELALGEDIEAVSGATISSRSFTTGVKRALENFELAFFPQEEILEWADGTYFGSADSFGGKLEVEVSVSEGVIASVLVTGHSDTPGISDGAFEKIPERIVALGASKVDAVSGATVSSEAIMKAVQNALEKAGTPLSEGVMAYSIPPDGTYRGQGTGFGGELSLEAVVKEGRLAEIVIVESSETPAIADGALDQLLPAIIEAQGPVDAVSGATKTSGAVLEALDDALVKEEGQ